MVEQRNLGWGGRLRGFHSTEYLMYKLMETIPQDGSFQLPIFPCLNATIRQSFFISTLANKRRSVNSKGLEGSWTPTSIRYLGRDLVAGTVSYLS